MCCGADSRVTGGQQVSPGHAVGILRTGSAKGAQGSVCTGVVGKDKCGEAPVWSWCHWAVGFGVLVLY